MKIGDRVFVHGYIDEIRKDIVIIRNNGGYFGTVPSEVVTGGLPSAQPEPDWDYSEETKQITLIVPEDVYDSAETIFLSVGHEGKFGIRGMVYSVQSSSSCVHENDSISRQAAIDAANRADYTGLTVEDVKKVTDEVVKELKKLPSAQPERPEQNILAWLLVYHTKSFDLNGRYMAHEVIGWLVHDFATAYMTERGETCFTDVQDAEES